MQELIDRLGALNDGPVAVPTQHTIDADLRRGRAALRRRRARRGGVGLAVVLALAGITAGVLATTGQPSTSTTHPTTKSATAPTTVTHPPAMRLVAYHGAQPPGFTIATVPQGYVLQGAQPSSLDIAQPGDQSSLDDFENKLVVMLRSVDATGTPPGTPVTVNGQPGTIDDQNGVRVLSYSDGTHQVVVQAWSNIDLTDQQLVQFAEGVTVTADAVAGVG